MTPLSILLDKYPDNPLYALFMAYGDFNTAFKAAWVGLNQNARSFEGPTNRDFTSLYANMKESMTRDLNNYLSLLKWLSLLYFHNYLKQKLNPI